MPKSKSQKVRDMEARKRASGLREIRVWVRDSPEAIEAVRRAAREVSEGVECEGS